ncbi:MAG: TonB-dependent receptor [Cyclobacteriaceae bacterium]|nr:TonB-dependent receptor [Cyclobacteriaceae bacterium]
MGKILLFLFLLAGSLCLQAQSVLDHKMTGNEQGKKLSVIFEDLEKQYPVRFYFLPEWIDGITLEQTYQGQALREVLTDVFLGTELNFLTLGDHDIILIKDPTQAIQRNSLITSAVRERKAIEKFKLGNPKQARKNQKVKIEGSILDLKSKEPLVGASVMITDLKTGSVTNADGKFEVTLPVGQHVVSFTYVNYDEKVIDLEIYADGEINVELEEAPTVLDEVVISDVATREFTTSRVGQTLISMREVKRAPALLGEVDLIRQIQVLPGVTTAGEAASGFNVRGGSVDQNLVLYDGMPVFNSSHAFGFFSAFNAEAIRDVTFYRGGIPAEYGGRISSVLDIRSKEGDYEKWKGSGGIGLISSNLMVSGPIKKDKTSIAVSARSTYSDWLINTIRTNYIDLRNSKVLFYDGAIKVAHKFSDKTKLIASGYASRDEFRLRGDSSYRWNNLVGSLRLDHQFSPQFSSNFSVGVGSYGYEVFDKDPRRGFNLSYQITYPSAKAEFHYQQGAHKLSFGGQSFLYNFDPGTLKPSTDQSSVKPVQMERQRSWEHALFVGDAITLSEKYFVEAGLRFSMFSSVGPATVNQYRSGGPIELGQLTGTRKYNSGETIKTYYGVEPRLSMRYSITPSLSLKGGYNRTYQYLHLITNTTAITPIDIWQPSGFYFKPQYADQVSLGLFKNFKDKTYEVFVEGYYKTLENIIDFKDAATLILNTHLETDLLQGRGRAYGVEFSVTRTAGRLTGSLNYTYSRSLRTIAGPTDSESINEGREYASNFDQPNIVNLNWKYGISRRYFFTGNFTYHTGRPVTVPQSGFIVDNFTIANFSDRNQYRIPDYHRLDVALVIEGNHRRKKFWDGTWTISVYNLYARKNPFSVFFSDSGNGLLKPYQLAIIGTALPSISYSFKF